MLSLLALSLTAGRYSYPAVAICLRRAVFMWVTTLNSGWVRSWWVLTAEVELLAEPQWQSVTRGVSGPRQRVCIVALCASREDLAF